jgi:hypothetical protein
VKSASAVRAETSESGSGTAEAVIVTIPGVLVKETAEVSPPVEKANTSKKVDVLQVIKPLLEGGTRPIVYEAPVRPRAVSAVSGQES